MDTKLQLLRDAIIRADFKTVADIMRDGSLLNARLAGNVTPLMCALIRDNTELADQFIAMGAKIDIITAVLMGNTDMVGDFLERTPSLIRKHSPWSDNSLLHLGARYGDASMVKLLMDHGMDPNEANHLDRLTPLFFSYRPPYQNAELLLSCGANINARAKHGQTVLHQAMMHDDAEWIKFLLQHGADPNLQTKARESPWMLAVKWKRFQAASLLEEFGKMLQ